MRKLKVEAIRPMAFETYEDVAEHLPHFIEEDYTNTSSIRHWDISARSNSRIKISGRLAKRQPNQCPPSGAPPTIV